MFRRWRLKKIHAKFLESCRNLKEGRGYWRQATGLRRWVIETVTPIPLLGLHQDGQRLLEALEWLEANCRSTPMSEETVRVYHRMICEGEHGPGGEYRKINMSVVGSTIPRSPPGKVGPLMKQMGFKLAEKQKKFDIMCPLDEAAVFTTAVDIYQRIGLIHPFSDGNGRVARLSMSHLLRRYGIGYVILPPLNEAPALMNALQEAHRGNLGSLVNFAKSCSYTI